MSRTVNTHFANPCWSISVAVLLLGCFAAGWTLHDASPARAEVREATQSEAFLSGGARSELVLREIAATLKRLDEKVERIERAAHRIAEGESRSAAPDARTR